MHPDLKIAIPRKIGKGPTTAQKYWDLVRKHGTSRRKMVDFICAIGGYSDRREHFAVSFNVKAYSADTSVENLWKLLTSGAMDVGPDPKLPPDHMEAAKALFAGVYEDHESNVWDWGVEEAYEGWRDSDTPYETFTGRRVEWSHEMRGRCGGHLCMTECGYLDLEHTADDLRGSLLAREEPNGAYSVDHEAVRNLFIICVQNTVDLTPFNAAREVEYRAAWRLWVSFCEEELDSHIKTDNLAAMASVLAAPLAGHAC